MTDLSTLFTRAKAHIFTPEELAEKCEYPFLTKMLKKRRGGLFPAPPHKQGQPHIIIHFPIDTSDIKPAPLECNPHADNQVLLQVKDFNGRYSAALFEEIEIEGKMHYMLCDITFDGYLHNRPPVKAIADDDIERFFRRFGDTVLKNVKIPSFRIAELNKI